VIEQSTSPTGDALKTARGVWRPFRVVGRYLRWLFLSPPTELASPLERTAMNNGASYQEAHARETGDDL